MEPTAIQHLMSAIRQNTSGTKHIPKLPPKLIGKDKDVIEAVLMELYKDVVENLTDSFHTHTAVLSNSFDPRLFL